MKLALYKYAIIIIIWNIILVNESCLCLSKNKIDEHGMKIIFNQFNYNLQYILTC